MQESSETKVEMPQCDFYSKSGYYFDGFSKDSAIRLKRSLLAELGITTPQIVEAASYSMAMVVRFALGLSATGGKVCTIINNSLCSQVALATLRHLVNAGAEALLLYISDKNEIDSLYSNPDMTLQLKILERMNVAPKVWYSSEQDSHFLPLIESSHNVIFGLFDAEITHAPVTNTLIEHLNESRIPIHCVDAPLGLDLDSGVVLAKPLFASSTLSLGTPYKGLSKGHLHVGRHYLCDISITKELYKKEGPNLTPLFSDQPVTQIFSCQAKREQEQES